MRLYPISGYVHFGYVRQYIKNQESPTSYYAWAFIMRGTFYTSDHVVELGASFD